MSEMARRILMRGKAIILAIVLSAVASTKACASDKEIKSVEFIGMKAPQTVEERSKAYTDAKVRINYREGSERTFGLTYNVLHYNTDSIDGVTAGMLYNRGGSPLLSPNGVPYISEAPDANTLLVLPGGGLYLITHFEYDPFGAVPEIKLPMTMNLAAIEQDPKTGILRTTALKNIDMSGVGGLWTPCAGSLSPWNTHLGSEEYEPDARCESIAYCPSTLNYMHLFLDPSGKRKPARAYDYGLVPEVTVTAEGKASVVKHRALGRISREVVQVMPDNRTAYQGDDGTYNVLTMFVADRAGDLSSGTLYAARWEQRSGPGEREGEATLSWLRLGHAADADLKKLANRLDFDDIFESRPTATPGFRTIKAGHSEGLVEHLRLKKGMEKAAAFLETRRYAAYVGATTEFEKFEGVALNAADRKVYLAFSRISGGMEDRPGDAANHMRLPRLSAGAVYEMSLSGSQTDLSGAAIGSDYVGIAVKALLLGEDIGKNALGETAAADKIANPDNIKFSEKMRTLFIGEDSSEGHINNFLWAYNVDTGHPARILSVPAGAEVTGLQVVEDLNGHAYIMGNYQHAGEFSKKIDLDLKARLTPRIDRSKAPIGYIGGLPALK